MPPSALPTWRVPGEVDLEAGQKWRAGLRAPPSQSNTRFLARAGSLVAGPARAMYCPSRRRSLARGKRTYLRDGDPLR